MKKTYYMLYNRSSSVGQYLMDDEYIYLNPGCKIILERRPTNFTENIELSMFRREVLDEGTQNKVSSKQSNKKKGE